jgi:hypothetical protein
MSVIGWIATGIAAAFLIVALFFVAVSLPDFNRYRRLRKM